MSDQHYAPPQADLRSSMGDINLLLEPKIIPLTPQFQPFFPFRRSSGRNKGIVKQQKKRYKWIFNKRNLSDRHFTCNFYL